MKAAVILSSLLILGIFLLPAFGQQSIAPQNLPLTQPGIKWDWSIMTDNYNFTVDTVSNYEMKDVNFSKDNKTLTLLGNSTHMGNIAEVQIPRQLIDGNYTVYQNGKQIFPLVLASGNTTLIVLKFNDTGATTTSIVGTTYLPEFASVVPMIMVISFAALFLTFRVRKI